MTPETTTPARHADPPGAEPIQPVRLMTGVLGLLRLLAPLRHNISRAPVGQRPSGDLAGGWLGGSIGNGGQFYQLPPRRAGLLHYLTKVEHHAGPIETR